MKKQVQYRSKNVNCEFSMEHAIGLGVVQRAEPVPPNFFARTAPKVAPDLLGLLLIHKSDGGLTAGIITETEAYAGPEDKACHAYDMRRTERNEALYGSPGTAYVYLIYGIHHCFNIVTFQKEIPHGVLIRSLKPVLGKQIMHKRRKGKLPLATGPGRLCQAMGIGRQHNKTNVVDGDLYVAKHPELWKIARKHKILKTPRIGIDYAGDAKHYLWRFVLCLHQTN